MRKFLGLLLSSIALTLALAATCIAQVDSNPLPSATKPDRIHVIFPAIVADVDNKVVREGDPLASPSISYKEGGTRFYITSDAKLIRNSAGSAQIELSKFKSADGRDFDLVNGTSDGSGAVEGDSRTYVIMWESVRLITQSDPEPVLTSAEVGSKSRNAVTIAVNGIKDKPRLYVVNSDGLDIPGMLGRFKDSPEKIGVAFEFDKNDPVTGTTNNIATFHAAKIEATAIDADGKPHAVIVDIGRELPGRAAPFKLRLDFPIVDLQGLQKAGYVFPTDDEFVSARTKIATDKPSTDRAVAEFVFDSTLTSIVSAKSRKRANVGLFGLHIKPTLPILTHNVYSRSGSPWWTAFRPLLDADVDTQHIDDSEAPNRIVFGADFELGRDTGIANPNRFMQQIVWINGVRYDSDRDFKLQTLYWHTELVPHFLNWEMTREQRLYQYRHPCFTADETCKGLTKRRARRFPTVSSYKIMPSLGYDLGGTVNRDNRVTGFPTTTISRLFVNYSSAIEIKRLFKFGIEDTYYFLENASRRRNRNYLETRLDLNTGALFNTELGSLQSAFTIKFQRGEVPPRFKPVNALSVGFTLYR